ncbi:hypothetical protein ANAPRD1_01271 [Anaplasma phagocytophilum]|nr:hypothetical protein ANAPRD1_01271 [Anaplasma phagocytophilum]
MLVLFAVRIRLSRVGNFKDNTTDAFPCFKKKCPSACEICSITSCSSCVRPNIRPCCLLPIMKFGINILVSACLLTYLITLLEDIALIFSEAKTTTTLSLLRPLTQLSNSRSVSNTKSRSQASYITKISGLPSR